jgi:hypothetical protein
MSNNSNEENNGEFVEVDFMNDKYNQYYEKYNNIIKNIKNITDVVDPTYVYRNEKTIDSSTKKEEKEKEEKEKEEKEEKGEKEYVLTPEEKEMLLYYEIEQEYYATLEYLDNGHDDYGYGYGGYGSNYNGGYDSY